MDFKKNLMILLVIVLLSSSVQSVKKIIFYEINTPGTYTKDGGLSEFARKIRAEGYEIASISKGGLSRESLSTYDLLIIRPSAQLKIEELSAILWFVATKGGGVLILGGEPSDSNQLMIPFGMTMDDGVLVDATDTIPEMDSKNFVIDRFTESETTRIIRKGISKLGFYNGHGMFISGNAECIVSGDSDTYSDTQSFQTGSYPCVAAATLFSKGLVFGLSDSDMLIDSNIKLHDNMVFAQNIIDWLSITVPDVRGNFSYEECQVMIGQLKLEKLRMENDRGGLESQIENLEREKTVLSSNLYDVSSQLAEILRGKIGPFTRNQWAIVLAGFFILGAALVVARRGGGIHAEKKREDDILGELGYEFEEEDKPGGEDSDEIDTDELDKELADI